MLKNASDEIDVSLVLVTVLLATETWNDTLRFMLHTSRKQHAGYSQVPEVDVVPQTVVVDFKQSVLIGYVSARQNDNSKIDEKMKLLAKKDELSIEVKRCCVVPRMSARLDQLASESKSSE